MKITIESTNEMVEVNGIAARVWEGKTELGIAVQCLVTRIAAHEAEDHEQFQRELHETTAPVAEERAFPMRMVL
jgi:hypothetical protein